jgi:hypothetical protein
MKKMATLLAGTALTMLATGVLATPITSMGNSDDSEAANPASSILLSVDQQSFMPHYGRIISFNQGHGAGDPGYGGHEDLGWANKPDAREYDETERWLHPGHGRGNPSSSETDAAPVPEPGTVVLMGAGLICLAIYGKRRKNEVSSLAV